MNKQIPNYKQRCPAMIEAGIDDPESKEGVLFCAGTRDGTIESSCPYPFCVVFEREQVETFAINERVRLAKELRAHKVSVEDICLILHKTRQTIHGYLKR